MANRDSSTDQPPLDHNQVNLLRALQEVRRRGIAHSGHIADATLVTDGRANTYVNLLRDAGLVAVNGHSKIENRQAISLLGAAGRVVGVDMTLDTITVAVGDLEYGLLNAPAETTRRVPVEDWRRTLDEIAELVEQETRSHGSELELLGVGIGLPGPVQRGSGTPESDHLLPGWKGVPIGDELAKRLGAIGGPRVVVGNDASFGALGVLTRAVWGNPTRAPKDLSYLRVTFGIGMGLVVKGHLVTGSDGYAGEIGHVRVEPTGPVCTRCGKRGCLEVVASEKAVIDTLRIHADHEGRRGPVTAADVARAGDVRTLDEVGKAGWHVGFVLAAAANVLNPKWFVLGGTLTEMPAFRKQLEEALHSYALPQTTPSDMRIATWNTLFDYDVFPRDRDRDIGEGLTPEQLGAMAFVIDEFGDAFLESRVREIHASR